MNLEHAAINVTDALAWSQWYVNHLGFTILRQQKQAPFTTFMADGNGMMLEVYSNPKAAVPDYASMHPLILHFAFVSTDPEADCERLKNAGATFVEEVKTDDGSHLIMMRDPWAVCLQLCKRGTPFT